MTERTIAGVSVRFLGEPVEAAMRCVDYLAHLRDGQLPEPQEARGIPIALVPVATQQEVATVK